MSHFLIDEVSKLSGLSRGQIEQLISRYGVISPWCKVLPGNAREFLPADVFLFVMAGELYRLGLNQATIRDIFASLPFHKLDPVGAPVEVFGGQAATNGRVFWIIAATSEGPEFVQAVFDAEAIGRVIIARKLSSPIIIDATEIAARIDRAFQSRSR